MDDMDRGGYGWRQQGRIVWIVDGGSRTGRHRLWMVDDWRLDPTGGGDGPMDHGGGRARSDWWWRGWMMRTADGGGRVGWRGLQMVDSCRLDSTDGGGGGMDRGGGKAGSNWWRLGWMARTAEAWLEAVGVDGMGLEAAIVSKRNKIRDLDLG
ncbi:hypothetical protein COCNU_04G009990 [Cocos nucifera]|uniref:Uncharacterized protein n=1 Tax=Cocos nucifera TaxID=13894 RepID=A0A8K0I648_COCNU|nr:hypothetical protein COCNU_04G009990 [Cocos nucifera]